MGQLFAASRIDADNYIAKKRSIIPINYDDVTRKRKRQDKVPSAIGQAELIANKIIKLEKQLEIKKNAVLRLNQDIHADNISIIIEDDGQDGDPGNMQANPIVIGGDDPVVELQVEQEPLNIQEVDNASDNVVNDD